MISLNRSIFYIYTPRWRDNAAGIKALHLLCDAINQKGGSAWLVFSNPSLRNSGINHDLKTPVLTRRILKKHKTLGLNPSVIYTETIAGNPLHANRVIRWLLNYPGSLGGKTEFWSSSLRDYPGYHLLNHLPILSLDTNNIFWKTSQYKKTINRTEYQLSKLIAISPKDDEENTFDFYLLSFARCQ